MLPRRLAPARCSGDRRRLVVECGAPHGLFSEATREPNRAAIEDGGVHLLGGPDGDLVARAAAELEYVSATAFALVGAAAARGGAAAARVRPRARARLARAPLRVAHARRARRVRRRAPRARYDAAADRVRMSVTAAAGGDAPTAVRVLPSPLARRLGLSTAALRVPPPPAPATVWPSEATGLWDYVELPPGFYGPAHRPMCTGQPLRLGAELENAVNRLYFPLGKPTAASAVSPHALVFSDPDGRVHSCAIPSGRYTPEQLCAHLEAGMATAAAAGGAGAGLTFSVSHFDDRFAFACERADPDAGGVAPALWPPLAPPAERRPRALRLRRAAAHRRRHLRRAAPHARRARRRRRRRVAAPLREQRRARRRGRRAEALQPARRRAARARGRPRRGLRARAARPAHAPRRPPLCARPAGGRRRAARAPAGPAAVADGEGGAERDAPEAPVALARGGAPCSCVVLAPLEGDEVHVLRLDAPRLAGLADAGACVQVACRAEPWNLCLGRPRSVPEHVLGFPRGAVQWGLDGSVEDAEGRRLPPFVAPHTHCLDHPDYVLMTLSESSGAALEHSYDGENRHVFCKLSLYPLFREERMLPRDTSLLRGNLSRFTLAFWNPDLRTPYRFHGAEFSFSLNFVSALGGG